MRHTRESRQSLLARERTHIAARMQALRTDIAVGEVLNKCEVLKRAGMWLPEPYMRPRAWLNNFEDDDKGVAATLLNSFVFYSSRLSDRLLTASFRSVTDGLPKGPESPDRHVLSASLDVCVFTPVEGECPHPTDSGHFISRKARQVLGIPESRIVGHADALKEAESGRPVVFLDDFVGSGDQFLHTWKRETNGLSFRKAHQQSGFVATYVAMMTTLKGMQAIHAKVPSVAISSAHIVETSSTVHGYTTTDPRLAERVDTLLKKYSTRLTPSESYIAENEAYRVHGYKKHGLMFAFEHSVPDATLPIYWSSGTNNWEPLIERT